MTIIPDDIELSPNQRKLIAEHADHLGKPWVEVVRAMLRSHPKPIDATQQDTAANPRSIRRQRESLRQLSGELDQLPVQNPEDGFSGRDAGFSLANRLE